MDPIERTLRYYLQEQEQQKTKRYIFNISLAADLFYSYDCFASREALILQKDLEQKESELDKITTTNYEEFENFILNFAQSYDQNGYTQDVVLIKKGTWDTKFKDKIIEHIKDYSRSDIKVSDMVSQSLSKLIPHLEYHKKLNANQCGPFDYELILCDYYPTGGMGTSHISFDIQITEIPEN